MAPQSARVGFFRDWQFGAALAAGPLFWAALWWATRPTFEMASPARDPWAFLAAAVAYPLLEEIVFRGGLQTLLLARSFGQRQKHGISCANLLTSAVFSLFHLVGHAAAWSLAVIFPSLVFGYFRERHASILPPILLHVFYNAGYLWLFG